MSEKKIRIFAGPNGSGKTTIINDLKPIINFGVYVNADDIEKELREKFTLNFDDYKLNITTQTIHDFFKSSVLSPQKQNVSDFWKNLIIENNWLVIDLKITVDSYLAADLAELIRQNLLV
jgi:predicted ATP-binding protein involved in virulence